jgi:hypothetical protein
MTICKKCGEEKKYYAKNYCRKCYHAKYQRKNKRLSAIVTGFICLKCGNIVKVSHGLGSLVKTTRKKWKNCCKCPHCGKRELWINMPKVKYNRITKEIVEREISHD